METNAQNTFLILGASVFLFIITLFIAIILMAFKRRDLHHQLEKARLQEDASTTLLKAQIEVQEQTFQQISRDLHDNVGQLLSTCRMLLGLAERQMGPQLPDSLHTANATLADAIAELRGLSKSLNRDWIGQFSFHDNLQQTIERINAGKVVTARYSANGEIPLPPEEQIMLFRVVQEAIQNALRHAQASHISAETHSDDRGLHITVANNGQPFDPATGKNGMGIANMQHRTHLLGGTVAWLPGGQGDGTRVEIFIPLKNYS